MEGTPDWVPAYAGGAFLHRNSSTSSTTLAQAQLSLIMDRFLKSSSIPNSPYSNRLRSENHHTEFFFVISVIASNLIWQEIISTWQRHSIFFSFHRQGNLFHILHQTNISFLASVVAQAVEHWLPSERAGFEFRVELRLFWYRPLFSLGVWAFHRNCVILFHLFLFPIII